jgi:hypothetical protein
LDKSNPISHLTELVLYIIMRTGFVVKWTYITFHFIWQQMLSCGRGPIFTTIRDKQFRPSIYITWSNTFIIYMWWYVVWRCGRYFHIHTKITSWIIHKFRGAMLSDPGITVYIHIISISTCNECISLIKTSLIKSLISGLIKLNYHVLYRN